MSSKKSRQMQIEELLQIMKVVSNNPLINEPHLQYIIADEALLAARDAVVPPNIRYVSVETPPSADEELKKTVEKQVNEICQKVRVDVLEQVRSDISRLLDAIKKDTSIENMTRALTESIRKFSNIPEVKKVYAFLEPDNLHFIVVHSAVDRIGILRRIVEAENSLDAKFEDVYFEFEILHSSEIDENSILDALLVFERP